MFDVKYTTRFKKDYKLLKKRGYDIDDSLTKRRQSFNAIVGRKAGIMSREVLVKPTTRISEHRRLALFASARFAPVVARPLKPKPSQRLVVRTHHEIVESLWRLVFPTVFHMHPYLQSVQRHLRFWSRLEA